MVWPKLGALQLRPEAQYRVCFRPGMIGRIVVPRRRNLSNIRMVQVDLFDHVRRAASQRAKAGSQQP